MSKADRKRARLLAVAEEQRRRREQAAAASPLSREQMDLLWAQVATSVDRHGHQNDLSITVQILDSLDVDTEATVRFLREQKIVTDFDLILCGDPCQMFGESGGRRRRMPLARIELEEMLSEVRSRLTRFSCDHTTAECEAWLRSHGHPVTTTLMACLALSGGCDCEIVNNVRVEEIYTD